MLYIINNHIQSRNGLMTIVVHYYLIRIFIRLYQHEHNHQHTFIMLHVTKNSDKSDLWIIMSWKKFHNKCSTCKYSEISIAKGSNKP